MKLILVKLPGAKTYSLLPIVIHRNLLTPNLGTEPETECIFELPAKFGVGKSKLGAPIKFSYPDIKRQWLYNYINIF